MGGAKKRWEELSDKGMNSQQKEAFVCSKHINDYAIKEFIHSSGNNGKCDYCQKTLKKVIELESLAIFISQGVYYFYEDAANSMQYVSSEGGYTGSTYDMQEILFDEIGLEIESYTLQKDIESCFDLTIPLCEKDPYGDREHDELYYSWNTFKEIVKHKARYLFSQTSSFKTGYNKDAYEILHDVGRRVDNLDLFTEISPEQRIFRCRQHTKKGEVISIEDIAAPRIEHAVYSNRMSPAGISMFYCAFDKTTAFKETFDPNDLTRQEVTMGIFKSKKSLYLLDLSKLPPLPSFFDPLNRQNYSSILFLNRFITDLSKDVKRDGKEHIEYIPTQIVTEYFRYTFEDLTKIKVEGIIYPSSKNKGENACVLFMDHKESIKSLNLGGLYDAKP